jgi:hypothetical protein
MENDLTIKWRSLDSDEVAKEAYRRLEATEATMHAPMEDQVDIARLAKRAGLNELQEKFLDLLRRDPGRPIKSIATEMGIKSNHVYQIHKRLKESFMSRSDALKQ